MGVLDDIPADLSVFYEDSYYAGGGADTTSDHGYSEYAYTAEHGVSWAAEFIKALCPGGAVLDIGCADGTLLAKLQPGYDLYGIEVNKAMSAKAEHRGVTIVGHDLLNHDLLARHGGRFDAVTAIAVFEHLRDIRAGFEAALHLMHDEGVLLFEVPLMSSTEDNSTWMSSSLEHVWYPSERGLRQLIEAELGCVLLGRETHIYNYASNYIGVVLKTEARALQVRPIVERILLRSADAASPQEQTTRMRLGLIHAAETTYQDIEAIALLKAADFNPMFVRRLVQLWQNDLWRRQQAGADMGELASELSRAQAERTSLETRVDVLVKDAVRNEVELTREILRLRSELRVLADKHGMNGAMDRQNIVTTRSAATGLPAETTPGQRSAPPPPPEQGNAGTGPLVAQPELMTITGHRAPPFPAVEGAWPPDRPLVSVIITSFNYGGFVEDAVNSALSQTFQNLEVIVVEGGSSDETSRLHVAEMDRLRVRVLMQGAGHFAGANRNYGISQARGRYICCLDADDILRSTYIEKAVFLLERHGFDVVSSAQESFGREAAIYHVKERPDLDTLLKANHVLTCALFRRAHWEKVGGYRDTDRASSGYVYEDWVFWVRLAALGARIVNLARDPLLLYRVHGISLSRGSDTLPMQRQQELVRLLTADAVSLEALDRSRRAAMTIPGTPIKPRPSIQLGGALRQGSEIRGPVMLLAMPFLILGGAERLLSSIVGGLTRNGWRVVVVTSIDTGADHGDATSWFESHTGEIFHLPRFLGREYWDDFLLHLVESRDVDLLWVVGSAFAYDNLRALKSRFPRLKVADLLFNTQGHTENNRRRSSFIDLIFVENHEVSQWLLSRKESLQRIRMVESGVDLDRLNPGLRSTAWRKTVLADSDDLLVGFCGRWSEEKDPLAFVEIARRCAPDWPVRFVMTGTGSMRPQIEAAVEQAGFLPGRFNLLGEVSDINVALASLDLLVLPSRLDGRPVVVMEALAVGTPVLASDVGGLPRLIHHGVTGWLCPPGSIDDFVKIVRSAIADPSMLAGMRDAARSSAEQHLDSKRMLIEYESGLRSLLTVARSGAPEKRC